MQTDCKKVELTEHSSPVQKVESSTGKSGAQVGEPCYSEEDSASYSSIQKDPVTEIVEKDVEPDMSESSSMERKAASPIQPDEGDKVMFLLCSKFLNLPAH